MRKYIIHFTIWLIGLFCYGILYNFEHQREIRSMSIYSIEFIAYVFELVLGIYGVYMAKKAMCNWMCILIFIVVLFIFLIGSFNCEKKY